MFGWSCRLKFEQTSLHKRISFFLPAVFSLAHGEPERNACYIWELSRYSLCESKTHQNLHFWKDQRLHKANLSRTVWCDLGCRENPQVQKKACCQLKWWIAWKIIQKFQTWAVGGFSSGSVSVDPEGLAPNIIWSVILLFHCSLLEQVCSTPSSLLQSTAKVLRFCRRTTVLTGNSLHHFQCKYTTHFNILRFSPVSYIVFRNIICFSCSNTKHNQKNSTTLLNSLCNVQPIILVVLQSYNSWKYRFKGHTDTSSLNLVLHVFFPGKPGQYDSITVMDLLGFGPALGALQAFCRPA